MTVLVIGAIAAVVLGGTAGLVWAVIRKKNMDYWIGAHLRELMRRRTVRPPAQRHVYF